MGASSTVSLAEGTHPEIVGPQYIEVTLQGLSGKNVRLELSGTRRRTDDLTDEAENELIPLVWSAGGRHGNSPEFKNGT